jgi:ribonuclease PH
MSSSPASRHDGRQANQLRQIKIERGFTRYAEGSVLICEVGLLRNTVCCRVPRKPVLHVKLHGVNWVGGPWRSNV